MIDDRPTYALDALCAICGKPFCRASRRFLQVSEETCSSNCQYIAQRTIPGFAQQKA